MRKLNQKSVSSLPIKENEFEEALQAYPGNKVSPPNIAIQLMKNGSGSAPLYEEPNFERWFGQTLTATKEILKEIYIRYSAPPGVILDALAFAEIYDRLTDPQVKAKVRSLKRREEDAEILERAAKVLGEYQAVLMQRTLPGVLSISSLQISPSSIIEKATEPPQRRNIWLPTSYESGELSETLKEVARRIRELGPSSAHRPKLDKVKKCAKSLANLFEYYSGQPLYKYVGKLIHAAFPEQWSPKGSIREAAKKLIKEKREQRTQKKVPKPKGQRGGLEDDGFQKFTFFLKKAGGDVHAQMEVGQFIKKIPAGWKTVDSWLKDLKSGKLAEQVWQDLPIEVKKIFSGS